MVLDKLSAVLKRTTDKIANAMFLDKDLVDSIVKDLQRALIEADVNIHLIKEITDTIKKAAFAVISGFSDWTPRIPFGNHWFKPKVLLSRRTGEISSTSVADKKGKTMT